MEPDDEPKCFGTRMLSVVVEFEEDGHAKPPSRLTIALKAC